MSTKIVCEVCKAELPVERISTFESPFGWIKCYEATEYEANGVRFPSSTATDFCGRKCASTFFARGVEF